MGPNSVYRKSSLDPLAILRGFNRDSPHGDYGDHYCTLGLTEKMSEHTLKRVAIIGAGISGVVSAGHLLAAGLDVRVFERSKAAGGVW